MGLNMSFRARSAGWSAALLCVLVAAVLAGCGSSSTSNSNSNSGSGASSSSGSASGGGASTIAAPKTGVAAITSPPAALTKPPATKPAFITIRAYSGGYEAAMAKSAGKQFTAATGVKVRWDTTDEFVSFNKIDQEIRAGQRPDVDASLQAQQRAYLDAARGLTLPISTGLVPNALKANRAVAAPPGTPSSVTTWVYMNPYSVSVAFIVNPKLVDPKTLTSWNVLTQPRFKKSLIFDQIYSSTAFGMAHAMGVSPANNPPSSLDPVWARIKQIRPNLVVLGSNTDVTTALSQGTGKIAITCTCAYNDAVSAGTNLVLAAPKDGLYEVADAYYIHRGIPAANYYYAQVFANYLYTTQTQAILAKEQSLIPSVPGTELPDFMAKQPEVFPVTEAQQKAANVVQAPIALMARNDLPWQTAFENAIK
jgi:putative spermidine/putrescine transport system substrate-binding protein